MPLTISTRSLARRKPLLEDFSVPPPQSLRDDGEVRLRDIIEHIVRHEVNRYNLRQESLRFDRLLTAEQIETGAVHGKVDPAAKEHIQPAIIEEAVGTALIGFEDGLFLVIIDEVERRDLDEVIHLTPSSRLVFVRLTFLAGA